MVGMSPNLHPFSLIFILGKRKNHKGQDQMSMEGWRPQKYFFGPKSLEWKGWCEQEHCYGEEPNDFEKAAGIFSEALVW
jgi:hypothetical protein